MAARRPVANLPSPRRNIVVPRPSDALPLAFVRPAPEVPAHVAAWLLPAILDPEWPLLPPAPIQDDGDDDEDDERDPPDLPVTALTCPACGAELPMPLPRKQHCPGCGEQLELRVDHHGVRQYLTRIDAYDWEAQIQAAVNEENAAEPTKFEQDIADWEDEIQRMGVFVGDFSPLVTTDGIAQEHLVELLMAIDDGSAALDSGPQVIAELEREPGPDHEEAVAIVIHGRIVGHLGAADAHHYQRWLRELGAGQRRALVVARLTGGQPTPSGGRGPVKVEIDGMPGPI